MDPWKMYFLLNMGIFHCYVSLPEGKHLQVPLGLSGLLMMKEREDPLRR